MEVSLATIYNTLNQFTEAGLLREVAVEGHKSYFDTNTSNHYHYYVEDEGQLIDFIATSSMSMACRNRRKAPASAASISSSGLNATAKAH